MTPLIVLGTIVLLAAMLLTLGGWLNRALPKLFASRLSAAVHALALLSGLLGGCVVWAVHQHFGRPLQPRDFALPLILLALVYGAVAFIWLKGLAMALLSSLVALFLPKGSAEPPSPTGKMEESDALAKVLSMTKQAAEGVLSLEELYEEWPRAMREQSAVGSVWSDVVSGVEHFPGVFWTGRPDWSAWEVSEDRRVLLADIQALERSTSLGDIARLRTELLQDLRIRRRG